MPSPSPGPISPFLPQPDDDEEDESEDDALLSGETPELTPQALAAAVAFDELEGEGEEEVERLVLPTMP